jgi:uncharacterized protein YhaN
VRFETLTFERYGGFTDRVLTFRANANLHVVLGPNGAGKTSALCGVGDLLFGFGKRTEYDFLYEAKALRIGARLRLADGSPITFRRRKGDKNTILDDADKPLSDDLLRPLLGTVTREAFFNEFGLTAQALREGSQELLRAGARRRHLQLRPRGCPPCRACACAWKKRPMICVARVVQRARPFTPPPTDSTRLRSACAGRLSPPTR